MHSPENKQRGKAFICTWITKSSDIVNKATSIKHTKLPKKGALSHIAVYLSNHRRPAKGSQYFTRSTRSVYFTSIYPVARYRFFVLHVRIRYDICTNRNVILVIISKNKLQHIYIRAAFYNRFGFLSGTSRKCSQVYITSDYFCNGRKRLISVVNIIQDFRF